MSDSIDYGNLMHQAMRGLIQKVLIRIAEEGLPGKHHFFITFDTLHPDVEIADWLADRYPGEMTIVVQHWFDGLEVKDDGFFITLNFGDKPEPLYVPYDAIRTFVDPSVEFGLRFEAQDDDSDDEPQDDDAPPPDIHPGLANNHEPKDLTEEEEGPRQDAEVVSLDTFRK